MVRGREILAALLDHPVVLSSSDHLKGTPEKKVSSAERPPLGRLVYVFQREYATVDPALVQVNRNHPQRTSVSHMDFPGVVDNGLAQMLSSIADNDDDSDEASFDVRFVDTSSNSIMPASFDRSSRGPDEIVRRIRVSLSSDDSNWKGRMSDWKYYASSLQQLSDSEFLLRCSTSPYAEAPDFVESERRKWNYLIENPDWRTTFTGKKPRIFQRTVDVLCCAVCTAPYALVEEMRAPTRLSPTTLSSQDASSCLSREGGRETKM
ncbi:hypothetical protein GW17_00008359 [Ensete ventricosum]|nr:hypothetical protein GW17_00008359 [Ensete ventricosum]